MRPAPKGVAHPAGLPPAVLLGGTYSTLSAARSLARSGITIYALNDGRMPSLVRHSRCVAGVVTVPAPERAEQVWLDWLAAAPPGAVVLPCSDPGVELLAKHRDLLVALGHQPAEANDHASIAMLDKAQTYALADKLGVLAPRTITLSLWAESGATKEIPFPCALKPLQSHRAVHLLGTKAIVVHDVEELRRAAGRLAALGIEALVTEIVPGPEASYCSGYVYLDAGGRVLAMITKRKLRQHPTGFGCGCFHETAWEPEAAALSVRFLRGAGMIGLGVVEFKRDARDGRLKLIECNPRLTAATELVRAAGADLARLAYDRALGLDVEPVTRFRTGLRLWFPSSDVRAARALSRSGELELRRWAASLAPPLRLPVFSPADPGPSLASALGRAARVLKRWKTVWLARPERGD